MRDKCLPLALPLSGVACRLAPGHATKGCGGKAPRPIVTTKPTVNAWNCLNLVGGIFFKMESKFEAARVCRLTIIQKLKRSETYFFSLILLVSAVMNSILIILRNSRVLMIPALLPRCLQQAEQPIAWYAKGRGRKPKS
jgi:hypothetical protein